jgi:hypothetical protein
MSALDAVKNWILFVAEEYDIYEAHHMFRPHDSLKPVREYFVYRFDDSATSPARSIDNSVAAGNNATIEPVRSYDRTLTVECYAENGLEILEALYASIEHPTADELLVADRLVIFDMVGIANDTTHDETTTDWLYTAVFRTRRNTSFSKTRADHIVSDFTLTGTVESDSGETVTITATST